jgi:hypothetical protein
MKVLNQGLGVTPSQWCRGFDELGQTLRSVSRTGVWELIRVQKVQQRRREPTVSSQSSLGPNSQINGMILLGPLASWLNRIPAAVLFAYFTIFLPRPFLRLPQRVIQFLMSLYGGQTACLVDGIGGFQQIPWLSHIKLLRVAFDAESFE